MDTLSLLWWQAAEALHVWRVLAFHFLLLLWLAALLLDALPVDHAVDAHALFAVSALARPEAHIIIMCLDSCQNQNASDLSAY